jgi:hypothetical protein
MYLKEIVRVGLKLPGCAGHLRSLDLRIRDNSELRDGKNISFSAMEVYPCGSSRILTSICNTLGTYKMSLMGLYLVPSCQDMLRSAVVDFGLVSSCMASPVATPHGIALSCIRAN